jgi:hypothetical protein
MKKTYCIFLVLTVLGGALWAGGNKDKPAAGGAAPAAAAAGPSLSGKKVIVADANSTHHLNLYVAYEKGLFSKRGLEVEIQQTSAGVAAVVGGEADIVFNCPTGVHPPHRQGAEHHHHRPGKNPLHFRTGGSGERALQNPVRPQGFANRRPFQYLLRCGDYPGRP